ncbi:FAD-binding protein [Balneicella halophila]|uniref:FAD-binding protein n=1 Tax=Balneicella halophila TaxID=1537566 RepID=UPI0026BD2E49|nr:FAD-binding protein [Balneicella halophila]
MQEAQKQKLPVTFRVAGTSLAGQAVSDSLLVITGDHWKAYEILDDAKKIRLQPGVIGGRANIYLAPYHKK